MKPSAGDVCCGMRDAAALLLTTFRVGRTDKAVNCATVKGQHGLAFLWVRAS